MKVIDPISVTTEATHARASSATYWDYTGTLQTVTTDVLRFNWNRFTHDFEGVLLEPAATNLLLNSATLSTQTVTVSSGAVYTLSFYGSGSVTLSGAATGTTVGQSGTVRTTVTFVTSSTSLTVTVSGSVTEGQLETGSVATSVIITTGAAVTRAADVITGTGVFYTQFTDATPAYNAGTAYALGYVVQYEKRLYESLQAANTGNTPDASPTWWLDTGPNNPFAMFDRQASTPSTGLSAEQYVCVALPSNATAVAVVDAANVTSIHLIIGDGYTRYSSDYESGSPTSAILTTATGGQIVTMAFNNATTGPPDPPFPSVAEVVIGDLITLGKTEHGAGLSLIDYSRKETDEFGVTTFVERPYAKRLNANVMVEKADFNTVNDLLFSLRATPTVWVTSDDAAYSSAIIYGFLRDMRAVIAYPTASLYSLEIEGLTGSQTLNGTTTTTDPVAATQTTSICMACSDETTALTTGTAKITFRMPYAMTLTAVRASLTTAQASGSIFTVDINEGGTSILSTKLTIDNTELTSTTAATPAVLSDAALADDAQITVDIDQIGTSGATGLKVYLIGTI